MKPYFLSLFIWSTDFGVRIERSLEFVLTEDPIRVVDAYFIMSCKSDGSYSAEQCSTGIVVSCHCDSEDGERLSRDNLKDHSQ